MIVCGFVIVEKRVADFAIHRAYPNNYFGIGRQWGIEYFGLENIDQIVNDAKEVYSNTFLYKVIKTFNSAQSLLAVINDKQDETVYEIIAIRNKTIADFLGEITIEENLFEPIGVDIDTQFSFPIKDVLLVDSIHEKLVPFRKKLNRFGLFTTHAAANQFIKSYVDLQKTLNLEPINPNKVELIEIFQHSEF